MAWDWIAGLLAGFIYGSVVSILKYSILWRSVLVGKKPLNSTGAVMWRYGVSVLVDIATLTVVFLLRQALPWEYLAGLVGTAVALVIGSRVIPLKMQKDGIPAPAGTEAPPNKE